MKITDEGVFIEWKEIEDILETDDTVPMRTESYLKHKKYLEENGGRFLRFVQKFYVDAYEKGEAWLVGIPIVVPERKKEKKK